ncbi:Clp protease N-terminal domain-containing protein, partial [Bacillus safensis]|uniref:Clp protease N-terminal domain-containing protein n=1 Tax=Bacillus safensis TaxID=561879 RepID=UPI002DD443A0
MDLNQMTTKTQEAIMSAQSLAVSHNHQEVDTVHLLFKLLEEQDGLAVRIFQKMNVDIEALKQGVENLIKKKPSVTGS